MNVVVAKKIWSCRTLILIMKMTLIPVIACKILAVKVIVLIQIFTPEAAPRKHYFLDSFKKFCKITKKTFRKRSMFVTVSDFWFTTLLKTP